MTRSRIEICADSGVFFFEAEDIMPDNGIVERFTRRCWKVPELNSVENIWQTVCSSLQRRWLVPRYAANEGCAGQAGALPGRRRPTPRGCSWRPVTRLAGHAAVPLRGRAEGHGRSSQMPP